MKYNVTLAPMVDRTDIHFRNFLRMINKDITLYTEMITTPAILNGDVNRLLKKNKNENPIVLQIATSSIEELKRACEYIKDFDYDEININAGCPSDRVSNYKMGAYLMSEPYLVKDMINVIKENTGKKVSVKHRIGIDGKGVLENDRIIDSYEELLDFVDIIKADKYIVHSRIAILKGLSPKENREIPPLDYNMVYNLKKDRPNLDIEINGGIKTIDDIIKHHSYVDSVMIGRALYDNPMLANEINKLNDSKIKKYEEILEDMFHYLESMNEKEHYFLRHTLGLFYNTRYSKIWKKYIGNSHVKKENVLEFLNLYKGSPL